MKNDSLNKIVKCKNCNDMGEVKYKPIEYLMYSWVPWKVKPCFCKK